MPKPSFPAEVVREKIHAFFPRVLAFAPILGGQESQTFRFVSEDRRFIFRLNSKSVGFEKDRFVFERFAKPNLPIPQIFDIGPFDDCFYCVSQELPGTTLQDLPPGHIAKLLSPTYEAWRAIANSDLAGINGFGRFDSQGITAFSTWRDFLLDIVDTLKCHWTSLPLHTNTVAIEDYMHLFCPLTAACPEERALVHGDFGSNNVLANHEQITGIVDWSESMIGDPLYDVANIFFWRTWLPCMEQQAQYFESHPLNLPNWEERIRCYQLHIGLSEFVANLREQRPEAVAWTLERCKQLVFD